MSDDNRYQSRLGNRRTFLKAAAAVTATGLAGCTGNGGGNGNGNGGNGNGNGGGNGNGNGDTTGSGGGEDEEIVVYTNVPFENIAQAYEEETGVTVNFNLLGGPQPVNQYISEAQQEEYGVDLIYNNSGITWRLHQNDIPSEFNVDQEILDSVYKFDGMQEAWEDALGSDISRMTPPGQILVNANHYNTNLVDDPPASMEELVDERFADRLTTQPFIMDATLQTWEHYHGTETAEQMIQEYDELGIDYVTGGGTIMEQLLGEQNAVGSYTNAFYASGPNNQGAPTDLVFPRETWYLAQTLCKPQNAPNPEGADDFCEWFLTEPGQQYVQELNGGSLPALEGMEYGNDLVQQRFEERLEMDEELYPMANDGETYNAYVERLEELTGVTW
jgi:ABC-type Fe3+ transport system substrate-binding protein